VLFNSLEYVVFLSVVGCAYHLCPVAWRRGVLLGSSYVFYVTWSVPFAVLLLAVSGIAFVAGEKVGRVHGEAQRRRILPVAIILLLAPLAAFKYLGALQGVVAATLGESSWISSVMTANFVGAVGISYYTLKLVSYVIDVYWDRIEPCREFSAVATYGAFFPQILSGPIQRAGDFVGQIERLAPATADMFTSGLRLILFGFFKKLVVADRLGVVVDPVFAQPQAFSGLTLLVASYLFAVQLYADFSGLTDIAMGSGRVLGLSSPKNFNSPFYAENVQEFWRRWHMTLTGWLGDYLFTPLRMALRGWGQAGLVLGLGINMLAIGIWHGPRWTYVLFGLVHATYLIVSTLTLPRRRKMFRSWPLLGRAHSLVGPFITFHMVVLSLVIFRAGCLADAWYIVSHSLGTLATMIVHLAGAGGEGMVAARHLKWSAGNALIACGAVVTMEVVHLLQRQGLLSQVVWARPAVRWAGYVALGFAILIWGDSNTTQFIYAKF